MNKSISRREQTKKDTIKLGIWTFAWLITLAIAVFGATFIWDFNKTISSIAITANLFVGLGMMKANMSHLKGLDELQQKIQLEATALSAGLGMIVGIAYSTLDITNVIAEDAEISFLVMFMGITYLLAVLNGTRKYQ